MRKLALTCILISVFYSCQEKIDEAKYVELESKYNKSIKLLDTLKNAKFFKFKRLLDNETNTLSDTTLINDYKALLGENDKFDLYIWNRVHAKKKKCFKISRIRIKI